MSIFDPKNFENPNVVMEYLYSKPEIEESVDNYIKDIWERYEQEQVMKSNNTDT